MKWLAQWEDCPEFALSTFPLASIGRRLASLVGAETSTDRARADIIRAMLNGAIASLCVVSEGHDCHDVR
jgi:hypothetical protein